MNNIANVAPKKDMQIYTNVALNIGKYLAKEAIWYKDMCNWTGHEVCVVGQKYETAVKACGIELYSGITGIASFLSELYVQTKDPIILHTLQGAINTIVFNMESSTINNYGYYSGKVGVGYHLWKIGKQLDDNELSVKGLTYIKSIKDQPVSDQEVDIVSGAAGAISVLLKLYYAEQDTTYLDMATKCGDFLLEKAIQKEDVWSWITVDPSYALTGYSHGASGIASALLELYATTQKETYWHAAMGGFKYEKSWYNAQIKNWPDLRQYDGKSSLNYGTMWCHGAPGIAISHLKAYAMTKHDYFLQEAMAALETTMQSVVKETNPQVMANFSLCHGLAGNADVLLYADQILQKSQYKEIAERAGDMGIHLYDATGTIYPSGVNDPSGVTAGQQENPGLMLGLAGTGYFYLRLSKSNIIESPLVP